MLPDRVSNPGPLTYESGALPIALRGPAVISRLPKLRDFKRHIRCCSRVVGINSCGLKIFYAVPAAHVLGKALIKCS